MTEPMTSAERIAESVRFVREAIKAHPQAVFLRMPVSILRAVMEGYDTADKRAEAAVSDLNAQGACITCKHDPHNGGTCPGFIDCHNPDSPMYESYHQEWRGPCADNQSGPEPGGEGN